MVLAWQRETKTVTLMEDLSELTKRLEKAGVKSFDKEQPNIAGELIYSLLSILIPVVLMVALFSFMFRRMNKGGGMMGGVGKSKAKAYVQKETGITFKDVAGQDEAKESLQEVVDFLHNPGKYTAIGAKLPKGALLVGPPGTGKRFWRKRGRRGSCAFLFPVRFGFRGDVCRCGSVPCPGFV